MSTPANPLASYRSYSYYHVLCMCDSSQTADILSNSNDLNVWDHSSSSTRVPGTPDLGRFSVKCITNDTKSGAGKYIVLINGATDATYVITQAKWSTVTAGSAVPGDKGTSLAVEGSIAVSEPKGVAFLDQLVKCSVALGVDASQVVYVLKTFFVGHLDSIGVAQGSSDGIDTVISDVAPLNCLVYDVTGTFTELGGVYEMSFVSIAHGASRLPQYSKINDTISFAGGPTLADTVTRLQDEVNKEYDEYYNALRDQLAAARGIDKALVESLLRRVKYVIEVGPEYKDPRYTVTDQPTQFKNGSGCNTPVQVSARQSTSIEAAISNIMQMSLQVQDDMSAGQDDKRYEYKIHTAVESKRTSASPTCSDETAFDYTIYYRVERFPTPKSVVSTLSDFEKLASDSATEATIKNDPAYQQLNNNIIRFEYLYTGQNVDILEFEIKVNQGLAYLQTATLTNTFKDQLDRAARRDMKAATDDVNSMASRFGGESLQIPVFFGTQLRPSMLQGSQDPSKAVDSAYTLTKHASIEMAEASMKITGNPTLLGMINRTTSAKHVTSGSTVVNEPYGGWSKVPLFAHVTVKMPRNNDDSELFTGAGDDGNSDYAKDFWFDGYYYIYGIDHVFENGEFSQVVQMLAIPKKGAFEAAAQTSSTVNTTATSDSTIPCGPTRTLSPETTTGPGTGQNTPPFIRPGQDGSPTNQADAQTSTQNKSLDDVPGWKAAKPVVKSAILNAANKYGVSPVTLASIIGAESSFNPSIPAPPGSSKALGLGQFVPATWLAQVKKYPDIGVDLSAPTSVQLAQRTDPVLNANATATLLKDNMKSLGSDQPGDVYMAHFMGTGPARQAIALSNSGNGKTLLRDAYRKASSKKGDALFEDAKRSNPSLINDNTTCDDIRAEIAKRVSLSGNQPKVTKKHTPSSPTSTPTNTRPARDAVAATINCGTQTKKNVQPCGPTTS